MSTFSLPYACCRFSITLSAWFQVLGLSSLTCSTTRCFSADCFGASAACEPVPKPSKKNDTSATSTFRLNMESSKSVYRQQLIPGQSVAGQCPDPEQHSKRLTLPCPLIQ